MCPSSDSRASYRHDPGSSATVRRCGAKARSRRVTRGSTSGGGSTRGGGTNCGSRSGSGSTRGGSTNSGSRSGSGGGSTRGGSTNSGSHGDGRMGSNSTRGNSARRGRSWAWVCVEAPDTPPPPHALSAHEHVHVHEVGLLATTNTARRCARGGGGWDRQGSPRSAPAPIGCAFGGSARNTCCGVAHGCSRGRSSSHHRCGGWGSWRLLYNLRWHGRRPWGWWIQCQLKGSVQGVRSVRQLGHQRVQAFQAPAPHAPRAASAVGLRAEAGAAAEAVVARVADAIPPGVVAEDDKQGHQDVPQPKGSLSRGSPGTIGCARLGTNGFPGPVTHQACWACRFVFTGESH